MNKPLTGCVAIVTGAGRGLGRAHAKTLAARGAAVIVNDLGGDLSGDGTDGAPAQQVVNEIAAEGGQALASAHDVSSWQDAEQLVSLATESFGGLDIVVNNAGILRDRSFANMSESDWDAVIRVHLKGHAATSHHALRYWRGRAKGGARVCASLIHTTSISAFVGAFGQANYATAKMGVIGLSNVLATEGSGIGVRSNVISPMASTRMAATAQVTLDGPPDGLMDPQHVATVAAWLADPTCPATGQIVHVYGPRVMLLRAGEILHDERGTGCWDPETLQRALQGHLAERMTINDYFSEEGLTASMERPGNDRAGF